MPVIHNKGNSRGVARKIIFPQGWDNEGRPLMDGKKPLVDVIEPGQHKKVSEEQFKHLRANVGDEIINLDDLKEMQTQFKEKEPEKPREGYLPPEEVDKRVEERVAEELNKRAAAEKETVIKDPVSESPDKDPVSESPDDLSALIDAMDRGDLIAFIEKEELQIDHKRYKQPNALKSVVLTAMQNKAAANSETPA